MYNVYYRQNKYIYNILVYHKNYSANIGGFRDNDDDAIEFTIKHNTTTPYSLCDTLLLYALIGKLN